MKNSLQANCKLAVQYRVRIVMTAVCGRELEVACVWATKEGSGGMEGERSHSQSDAPEEWSLQQHSDQVLCSSRPEDKILY